MTDIGGRLGAWCTAESQTKAAEHQACHPGPAIDAGDTTTSTRHRVPSQPPPARGVTCIGCSVGTAPGSARALRDSLRLCTVLPFCPAAEMEKAALI